MNDDLITKIATDIVNQAILGNYKFYLLVMSITVISSVFVFFIGSYLKKRGESFATKQDFQDILTQIKQTTTVSEEIKSQINSNRKTEEDKRKIIREKLEEIFEATHNLELWFEKSRSLAFKGKGFDVYSSPMSKIEVLHVLYFPKCKDEFDTLEVSVREYVVWILNLCKDSIAKNTREQSKDDEFDELHKSLNTTIFGFRKSLLSSYSQNVGL